MDREQNELIYKLASKNAGFRDFLIQKFSSSYKDYVKDKKRKREKPLSKDQWEAKVLGKGEKDMNLVSKQVKSKLTSLSKNVRSFEKRLFKAPKGKKREKVIQDLGKEIAEIYNGLEKGEKNVVQKKVTSMMRKIPKSLKSQDYFMDNFSKGLTGK
jgi:predicted nuclease with TOPRIM domain